MCLLAILYRMFDDSPLVLVANREEDYARGGTPLDLRAGPVPFIAGLDPVAGGTWFGINAHHLVVAVTNRPKSAVPGQPRSRGLLVKDLLELSTASEAARAAAKELDTKKYAGCNIVCGDCESLWIVHGGDWLRMRSLSPGLHVLTNADINDSTDVRIREITARVLADSPRSAKEALDTLSAIACSTAAPVPICLRGDKHGTVASTLLALNQKRRLSRLLHAAGAPADCPYVDRTDLLWVLESLAGDTQK
jgi:hypothetical protein